MIRLLNTASHIIHVYRTKIKDMVDLKEKIEQEIKATKKRETLKNVFDDIVKGLKFCLDANDNTFQQHICGNF